MNKISQLIYDNYKGRIPAQYSNVSAESRDEFIRNELNTALGLPADFSKNFNKKVFRQAWREGKNKCYAIIEDVCTQIMNNGDLEKDAFYNQFVEVKNLALGDKNVFYVEGENELEFAEFSGSHFDLRRTRLDVGQSFSLEMKDFGIKVYEYFERVQSGRCNYVELVSLIIKAQQKKLSELAQGVFATALTTLPSEFVFNGTYNEDSIMEVLGHVEASNGAKPTLVATEQALRKLQGVQDLANASDSMKDTVNSNGILPVWKGYNCIVISQGHKSGTFEFTMPKDQIFAVTGGDKLVKMVLEGDVEVKEVSDGTTNADGSLEQVVRFKAGCSVCYGKMIGSITLA